MILRILLLFVPFFYSSLLFCQPKVWISKSLVDSLSIPSLFCSKWLSSCICYDSVIHNIETEKWPVVTLTYAEKKETKSPEFLGFALEQMHALQLHQMGLTGRGVKIGVIDGGFLRADSTPSLSLLFKNNQIKAYKDFITPELPAFGGNHLLDDDHGTDVLQMIGGFWEEKKILFGLACDADYYLARTDHGGFERRIEEYKLIEALEWLDSLDVKIVNISLGYSMDYSNPEENYLPSQMDGKTSMVARAVDTAFYKKNMLIIVAAGNEGDVKKWQILSTPADAKGALSVGATKMQLTDRMNYSSIGPTFLPYIKPEISCFATNGTSFSAPIITGLAAALAQHNPSFSAADLKSIIIQSGNLWPFGNTHVGYGVPMAERSISLLKKELLPSWVDYKTANSRSIKIKLDSPKQTVVVLHKSDSIHIVNRQILVGENSSIRIRQFQDAPYTTLIQGMKCTEIKWPEQTH